MNNAMLTASVAMVIASHAVNAQSSAPAQNAGTLDEVIVTAQRRSELSVNVPISITSISADQLGKGDVQQLGDIMKLTPGMRFDNLGANAQPTIRGVGTSVIVAGAGSNVALYTDGFYSPNPLMADFDLLNVEGVQVLKGPQGTLFGRNATGGAILVTTKEPSGTAGAALDASYGSYNTQRYALYATSGATGGASDTLAFDVAGLYRSGDGYLDNIITGSDTDGAYENKSIRLGARWEVTDKASVLLRYTHAETDDPTSVAASPYYAQGVVQSSAKSLFGATVATEPYDVSNGFKPEYFSRAEATQLTVKVDLDFAALTSYTQYRDEIGTHHLDFDMSSLDIYHYIYETDDDAFTQEFLLSSTGEGRLQWTTGLFYFVDQTEYPHNRASTGDAFFPFGGSGVEARSFAVFGDATYELQDNLYLTVGLRYSEDESIEGYYIENISGAKINLSDIDDEQLTPRVTLRYSLDKNSNVYASYSEGFKSGILNVAANSTTGINVKPEEINAYEVGYKYSSGAASFDVSAFYYDYKNLQTVSYFGTDTIIKNVADSSIYGLDMQTRYAFTDRLNVNLGLAYLDAEYDKFEESQVYTQCPTVVDPSQPQCVVQTQGLYVTSDNDASGLAMQRSPELTGTLGVNYGISLAGGLLDLSGTLYHTSSFYFDTSERYKQEAYDLLSARAAWTDPSDHYTLAVYGDNLTDEEYRSQVLPQAFGPLTTWGAPRTFGVSVGINY
jgi:iron complex outermembrane recepter protein